MLQSYWLNVYSAQLLTAYLHCRGTDWMSTVQSYWLHIYIAEVLTECLHCRVTDWMSPLQSYWPHVYNAELLIACLCCKVTDYMSTLQSYWLNVSTAELLTSCLQCRVTDCMSTLPSYWLHVYAAKLLTACLQRRVTAWMSTLQRYWLNVYTAELLTECLHCRVTDRRPTCFQVSFSFYICHQSVKVFCIFSLQSRYSFRQVLLQNTVFKTYCSSEVTINNNRIGNTYCKGASAYKTCLFVLCNVALKWKYATWEVIGETAIGLVLWSPGWLWNLNEKCVHIIITSVTEC
jgi:hypothetical protein